jgi:hypothetical protein
MKSKIDLRPQLCLVQHLHPASALSRNPLGVEAQGRRRGGVAELGAHVGDRRARREEEAREGVAEVVQPERR